MKITHPPEVVQQMEIQALHTPHGLFVVDRLLNIDVGPFQSKLTFGHAHTNGVINLVATLQMDTPTLHKMVEQISQEFKSGSDDIKQQLAEFASKLTS